MKYCFKEIKEDEVIEFLLNPFERAAYFESYCILKLQRNTLLDDFFITNENLKDSERIGHVMYDRHLVMVIKPELLNKAVLDNPCIKTINEYQEALREGILSRIETVKNERLEDIMSQRKYKDLYDYYHNLYNKEIIFSLLGTKYFQVYQTDETERVITDYVVYVSRQSLMNDEIGDCDIINSFVDKLFEKDNFIIHNVLIPEMIKKAEEYVAIGKFSLREQILIDFIESLKAKKPKLLRIETKDGNSSVCRPVIDCDGTLLGSNGVDFEDVKRATFVGKEIYTKK